MAMLKETETYTEEDISFQITGLTKMRQSGPPRSMTYRRFTHHPNVCPVITREEYKKQTKELRKQDSDMMA